MLTHIAPPDGERLTASQVMDLYRKSGGGSLLPRIKGWVQCTTRELPFCKSCGHRLSWDAQMQAYICEVCTQQRGGLVLPAELVEPGKIVQQCAQENMILRPLWPWLTLYNYGSPQMTVARIGLSSHDRDAHELWSYILTNYANTAISTSISASVNFAGKYWTFSYTFGAPTAPGRTIRVLGLGPQADEGTSYTYTRGWIAVTLTRLTSSIYQSNTQTFEVVYKFTFVEV